MAATLPADLVAFMARGVIVFDRPVELVES
jgi:hypothetical protein